MIRGQDISGALSGVLAMARADEKWADKLDMSADAVFRSFWAMPLALPPHLLAIEGQRRVTQVLGETSFAGISPVALGVSESVAFLIAWFLQVGLLANLARRRCAGWRISPLIIGFNWSMFLSHLVFGLLLGLSLILGAAFLAVTAAFVVIGLSIWLEWGVVRRSLDTPVAGTIGIMVMLSLVSLLVSFVLGSFFTLIGVLPDTQVVGG